MKVLAIAVLNSFRNQVIQINQSYKIDIILRQTISFLAGEESYLGSSTSKDRQYWMSEVKKEFVQHVGSEAVLSGGSGRSHAMLRQIFGGGSRTSRDDSDLRHLGSSTRSSARSKNLPLQVLRHTGGNWTPYPRRRNDPLPGGSDVRRRARKLHLQALRHTGGNWTPYPRRRNDPLPGGSDVRPRGSYTE
jgi:hypothetical protein